MSELTLTLKATRIVSAEVDGGYILVAFRPSITSIKAFKKAVGRLVIVDLDDETGRWSNGRLMEIDDINVSEDNGAATIRLLA